MVAYMLATLSLLNRGKAVQNVAISVGFPLALFLLFDRLAERVDAAGFARAAVVSGSASLSAPARRRAA